MIIFLSSLVFLLGTGLFFSVRKNFQLVDKLEEIDAQVEESLDILDDYYQRIDVKSKTEIFFEDPLVKGMLQDIKGCKDAVLLVAHKIYSPLEEENNNDEGKEL